MRWGRVRLFGGSRRVFGPIGMLVPDDGDRLGGVVGVELQVNGALGAVWIAGRLDDEGRLLLGKLEDLLKADGDPGHHGAGGRPADLAETIGGTGIVIGPLVGIVFGRLVLDGGIDHLGIDEPPGPAFNIGFIEIEVAYRLDKVIRLIGLGLVANLGGTLYPGFRDWIVLGAVDHGIHGSAPRPVLDSRPSAPDRYRRRRSPGNSR